MVLIQAVLTVSIACDDAEFALPGGINSQNNLKSAYDFNHKIDRLFYFHIYKLITIKV